jgi:hypothetical protein
MGAAVSEPVSHADLQNKTIRTRALMEVILQYMLNQVSIKDFAALSNPVKCKEYVVFMANNLFQYFHKIRVLPVMDQRGFLAFRRMDELQKDQDKMSKEQDAQKQSLCLSLSYFYTRIFQIYGALALTLIDDVQYMSATGAVKLGTSQYLSTPGESTPIARPRPRMGGGGPGPKDLGNFYFLSSILQQNMEQMGYTVLHDTYGKTKEEIYFKTIDKEKKGIDDSAQEGRFAISYPGIYDYARWYITASKVPSSTEIRVTFGELSYTDQQGRTHTIEPPRDIVTKKEIQLIPNANQPSEFMVVDPSLAAGQYMKARFRKMLEYVKKMAGIKGATTATTTTTTISDSFADTGVDPKLALERIRSNLTKDKPPGHCVARALQLLRTPVLSGKDGISHICKVQFYETTKGPTRAGLPSPGGLLTSDTRSDKPGSAGLAAFSQLFYDMVSTGTPKLMIGIKKGATGQPSSFEQYTRFMRLMSHAFEDNESAPGKVRTDAELQAVGLDGLRNKRDEKKCTGDIAFDHIVPADVAQKVQKVVQELFKIQFRHATECGKIMAMLFDIKYDAEKNPIEIGFSTNLLKQGFPELERINYLAREVLLKYYARCEGTYQQGMNMILDDHTKRRTAARKEELTSAPTVAKAVQGVQAAPKAVQSASRNAKGRLLAPGATHAAIQPVTVPTAAPTVAPTAIQTGPPLLRLAHAPTAPQLGGTRYNRTLSKSYLGSGTRKRSTYHTVTATKR